MSPNHPHHRGEGKDPNDLTRMVTVIEGRQPPTLQGEGGGLNVSFGRKHTYHTTGGQGERIELADSHGIKQTPHHRGGGRSA